MASTQTIQVPGEEELRERLRQFLQIHCKSKVLSADRGALKMLVLHSKNHNAKIKEKMINYKLLRVSERLLEEKPLSPEDAVICDFLISELYGYYRELQEKGTGSSRA